jgi:hypothetical protein
VRLASLGVVAGARGPQQQVRPAVVLSVGETALAIEREIASEIFVKRLA